MQLQLKPTLLIEVNREYYELNLKTSTANVVFT